MTAITVQADLMEEVRHLAEQRRVPPEEIFNIALRRYLRDAQEHKIQEEAGSFRAMHPDLVKQFLGEVVAIHEGQVVDHDLDFAALHQRIRQRFGRTAVLLRRVETEPERVLTFRSPRIERGAG
jgi:hypothetical protein